MAAKKVAPKRAAKVKPTAKAAAKTAEAAPELKIDVGCGKNKREGFVGFDQLTFDAVDAKVQLAGRHWNILSVYNNRIKLPTVVKTVVGPDGKPRKYTTLVDNCVDEVHCSHFLEHLTNFNDKWERVHFFNELWRVMKPDAKCTMIIPHWASSRYYGDPSHKEPFSEMGWFYLDPAWRAVNAPHVDVSQGIDYACNFFVTYGYGIQPELQPKPQEHQMYALKYYKEAAQDMIATLVKKPMPE